MPLFILLVVLADIGQALVKLQAVLELVALEPTHQATKTLVKVLVAVMLALEMVVQVL
jgi:hypothetical protein